MGRDSDKSATPSLRIGLFGGTFDPPHRGHIAVATDIADSLELDHVLWIPASHPPHKSLSDKAPFRLRLEMTRAVLATDSRFKIDQTEAEDAQPSYTVETVQALKERYPEDTLFLIIGTDQFCQLNEWKNPEKLLGLVDLVVMDRYGQSGQDCVPPIPGADRACFVSVRKVDISSTEVRVAVKNGLSLNALIPSAVEKIIVREGLYKS